MRHPQYEDLKRNMVIFEELTQLLEPYGLETDCSENGDWDPGVSLDFDFPSIYIDRGEDGEEQINFSHWLYFVYERDGKELSEVLSTMSFSGGLNGYFQLNIQHRAGVWSIIAEYSAMYDALDETPYESILWADLLGMLGLVLNETHEAKRELTYEQAFDAIRIMAEFFNKTKATVEAAKQIVK